MINLTKYFLWCSFITVASYLWITFFKIVLTIYKHYHCNNHIWKATFTKEGSVWKCIKCGETKKYFKKGGDKQ